MVGKQSIAQGDVSNSCNAWGLGTKTKEMTTGDSLRQSLSHDIQSTMGSGLGRVGIFESSVTSFVHPESTSRHSPHSRVSPVLNKSRIRPEALQTQCPTALLNVSNLGKGFRVRGFAKYARYSDVQTLALTLSTPIPGH